jgi:hypothetical protein
MLTPIDTIISSRSSMHSWTYALDVTKAHQAIRVELRKPRPTAALSQLVSRSPEIGVTIDESSLILNFVWDATQLLKQTFSLEVGSRRFIAYVQGVASLRKLYVLMLNLS